MQTKNFKIPITMNLIELHILQSFPVSCLNRDDVGAPKTAVFGGVTRARLSSQSLKRAIREHAASLLPSRFHGARTKLIVEPIATALIRQNIAEATARETALKIADKLAKLDSEAPSEEGRVRTLTFLAPSEIDSIAAGVATALADDRAATISDAVIERACKRASLSDGADIALFGRMVASLPSLTLEGAAMFGHALSTHRSDNDIDFYSAVDDLKPKDEPGAGMMGTLEFSSAVYYRYVALNLGLLSDGDHLGALSANERREVVDAFLRATLLAVPGARKNSMNANTLPSYVLGIHKSAGQPIQLVNAFESPVRAKSGLVEESVTALKAHHTTLKATWGIQCDCEVSLPDCTLTDFCNSLTRHVQ